MKKDQAQIRGCAAESPLRAGEQGFMLLGLMVAIAIILLVLSVAASKAAFSLHRDREAESARRADQYVRAIRRFYLKNGNRYPGSIEQLENTNRVRYLRQRYVDPLTGKADYRLIPVGQNKTTVKGFFGEPLGGIATTGLGSAAGLQSSGVGGIGGATGTTATMGFGGAAGASGAASNSGTNGASVTTPSTNSGSSAGSGGSALGSASGLASQAASGLPGSTGPFMGVGSSASGNSILVVNEQTSYDTWEFLYDPRIEKLKAAAALNAGPGSVGAGSLGTTPGSIGNGTNSASPAGSNGGTTPTGGTPPTQP